MWQTPHDEEDIMLSTKKRPQSPSKSNISAAERERIRQRLLCSNLLTLLLNELCAAYGNIIRAWRTDLDPRCCGRVPARIFHRVCMSLPGFMSKRHKDVREDR